MSTFFIPHHDYTVSVDSKAPHYHLVEEGHDMYTLSNWKKAGDRRRFYGDTKLAGEVPGRKFVARYMAARAERASLLMAEATLDKILKGAGL